MNNILILETEISIMIPSTQGVKAQKPLTRHEMDNRVKSVQRYLAKLFGGFTAFKAQGGYVLNTGKVVQENVVKVTSFGDLPVGKKYKSELVRKCQYWCVKWGQESIGLEWDGDLLIIPKSEKKRKK